MASIRDVAKLAGVSTSTVSIILNQTPKYVSEESRRKVLEAVKELNYSLPPKKHTGKKTVAVILPVATSSFFSNVLSGIENVISPSNHLLIYYNSNYDFEKERSCLDNLVKQNLSGIILDSVCPVELEEEYSAMLADTFISKNIPVVMLERNCPQDPLNRVFINHYSSAYRATEHLIEKGHTRIAHIMGNEKMHHTAERLEGYRQALLDHDLPYFPDLVCKGDFTPYSGYIAAKELLNQGEPFTAIFSANDQMAIGAIKALQSSGFSVPHDIAIVGFDDLSVSSIVQPALTTVHVPTYQMGRMAAKIILDSADAPDSVQKTELETTLIVRRSSDETSTNEWELFGW